MSLFVTQSPVDSLTSEFSKEALEMLGGKIYLKWPIQSTSSPKLRFGMTWPKHTDQKPSQIFGWMSRARCGNLKEYFPKACLWCEKRNAASFWTLKPSDTCGKSRHPDHATYDWVDLLRWFCTGFPEVKKDVPSTWPGPVLFLLHPQTKIPCQARPWRKSQRCIWAGSFLLR